MPVPLFRRPIVWGLACRFALLVLVAVAVSGCVAHVPVSESAMFHDPDTRPTSDRTWGVGVAGTVAPTHGAARAERASDGSGDILNPRRLSGGPYLASFNPEGRFGVSATLGAFVAGWDATVQLWRRNYLTAAVSVPGQGQVIVQHRAFNSPQLGAAVGLGGRYDALATEGDASFGVDLRSDGVYSVGARGLALVRAVGDTGGGLKLTTYVGYAPGVQRPVLNLSLTVGRF